MKFKRRPRPDNSINLTPLIDVVFLLLIFFMVSTTFTRETRLLIELPDAEGEQAQEAPPHLIEVVVSADGAYRINGQTLVNRHVDTLVKALELEAAGNVDVPLIISADASSPHRAVVRAMDAAGRVGFRQLQIATQEPEQ
ncbi:MAG TPA: biopolymer transporter ExbD [Porticoccaceae bacterium]